MCFNYLIGTHVYFNLKIFTDTEVVAVDVSQGASAAEVGEEMEEEYPVAASQVVVDNKVIPDTILMRSGMPSHLK